MGLTEDIHPNRGCESCDFTGQLWQHPEFCVYDSLEGRGAVELWDIVRLPSNKKRCEGSKWLGEGVRAPLLR